MSGTATRPGPWTRLIVLLVLAALLVPALALAQEPDRSDWNQVNLIYMSDVRGKIEPCG